MNTHDELKEKICVSIGQMPLAGCLETAAEWPLIELRLDLLRPDAAQLEAIDTHCIQWVATCRPGSLADAERHARLAEAIRAGATFVDIEYEAEANYRHSLIALAARYQCAPIISYHNCNETPADAALDELIHSAAKMGCAITKIAVAACLPADCSRVMALYARHEGIVAFAMGNLGRITRVAAPFLGAPFTFACADAASATAPGQISARELLATLKTITPA